MPTYETPEAISVNAHVGAGSIQFTASERPDTVVEVKPGNPKRGKDVKAAEQTEVSYAHGVLTVRTTERRMIGPSGIVNVTVELPTGSAVDLTGSWTHVTGEGRLGKVDVKTSGGDFRLDTTGPLRLRSAHGSIRVDRVEGMAEITASSSNVRVGLIDGHAVLKNSHGTTFLDAVTGELRVNGAHGDIEIGRAESSVAATTAYGALRVADVARGTVQLETNYGAIEVGIREGTAAWLDANADNGQVRNTLTASDAPAESEDSVKVRARTKWGNIDIRRAKH
ncbi:DUF4097 family beta strand repeat-containing protein [Streptomyces endophyticus]|uniref:DUF4097 family beta strand repeat-containing protein n=1 Tax=Streptomyces endophyticus TaxID=714166 RepID=A0ABU6F0K9_9ACTN|nr:DUF4097 family beta strand repeat-containing protein [Streptomyces endophyticus]MEB8337399.1 DUF4097 family beta strand repeat-containing protein [Streptomyces endophyticus]